ncbi:uncharacterized protein BXIN_0978 [Babesia sp. Xinjiang]|uniref:uncharacterized protein n=1 Tax=Babesia sp. Xinjiang TaxID=462227 RepID=UPI000A25754F|nr:uncharacterized protein BXIN_0978 [Babesia sp. Xinjiang]ORM42201.1 hypothetical protein BXIN_0978 [Babesia sp. Xinjiang]
MARKRDRNSSRKLWYPDSTATQSAESLCATFNSPESPPTSNDIARNLKNTLSHKYCINYYTGHTATKELLESLFNMTKRNMYDMYNESGFLGGWKDRMKYRELSAAKTHIITVSGI